MLPPGAQDEGAVWAGRAHHSALQRGRGEDGGVHHPVPGAGEDAVRGAGRHVPHRECFFFHYAFFCYFFFCNIKFFFFQSYFFLKVL